MLDSINGLTDGKITRIIEENLFEQIRYYNKSPGSILVDSDRIIKFKTSIPLPFFNCVLYYDLDSDSLRKEIIDFKEYGKSSKTSLLWLKGPSSMPADAEAILMGEGFKYDDHMTGMAADINKINKDHRDIPNFRVELVRNRQQLSGWVYSCLKGFDENGKNFHRIYEFEESLGLGKDLPWVRFTGIIGDQPVATSAVFMGSKVAGLDNVTTIPGWRKKGIAALMVKEALKFSQLHGYKVGVLQASDMGINLYRYLGFREFAESREFIWKDTGNTG